MVFRNRIPSIGIGFSGNCLPVRKFNNCAEFVSIIANTFFVNSFWLGEPLDTWHMSP